MRSPEGPKELQPWNELRHKLDVVESDNSTTQIRSRLDRLSRQLFPDDKRTGPHDRRQYRGGCLFSDDIPDKD
jgi:hypothetical protein